MRLFNIIKYSNIVVPVLLGIMVTACTGNTTSSSSNSVSSLSLNEYINMLEYTPLNSTAKSNTINIAAGVTGQQSFTADGAITLNTVQVDFYGSNDCNDVLLSTVVMNASTPLTMPAGTYRSTNKSNFALANRYVDASEASWAGPEYEFNQTNSIKFTYTYNEGPGIMSQCLTNPNMNNQEKIGNYLSLSESAPCANDASCGFSQNYNVVLVTGDYGTVDITPSQSLDNVMMGSSYQFVASITGNNGDTSTVNATFINSAAGVITSNPSPCTITVGGTSSCTFTVNTLWDTSFDNNNDSMGFQLQVLASNYVKLNNSLINYNEVTPFVYLIAPIAGASSSSNAGITYSDTGSRFIAATTNTGAPCNDALIDTNTGLMWIKNLNSVSDVTYSDAVSEAANINTCGYTDWSLPSINQFASLFNYVTTNQGDWLVTNGFTGNIALYWTNVISVTDDQSQWVTSTGDTSLLTTTYDDYASAMYVRQSDYQVAQQDLVKIARNGAGDSAGTSGVEWPETRFITDTTGNCVTDNLTGLTWVKNAALLSSGGGQSIATVGSALYLVNQMNINPAATGYALCGYTDWRVPNPQEFRSLINYGSDNIVNWLNSNGFNNFSSETSLGYCAAASTTTILYKYNISTAGLGGMTTLHSTLGTCVPVPVRGGYSAS